VYGRRQYLKPGISELQPRRFVVGVVCVFSLASAIIRVPAVLFKFVRRNDLLRVFQQAHYGRRKRSKDRDSSKMCPVLISYNYCFDLKLIASFNRLAYDFMHGLHGMFFGGGSELGATIDGDSVAGDPASLERRGTEDRGEYSKTARTTAKAVIGSVDLVIRLTQRSFLYLAAVYVLDPNLRLMAPPLIRFENGVAEIIGKYLGDVFFALNFDFSSHMRSSLVRVFTFVSCDSLSRVRTESACHRI
jgi:hypothetical protein